MSEPRTLSPLLHPQAAADLLGTSLGALRCFLARKRPKLGSHDLQPTRIMLQRRTAEGPGPIVRPAKPVLRVSAFELGRFVRDYPKKISRKIPGWIELVIDEVHKPPKEPRPAVSEEWRPLPEFCSQFLLAAKPQEALGRWLAELIGKWVPQDVSLAGVHLSIRLDATLLLRLELPARLERNVSVRLFGPGNKQARQLTITFEDGSVRTINLGAGLPAEAEGGDHATNATGTTLTGSSMADS